MTEHLRYNVDEGVGVISFNRPDKHNALTDEMAEAFRAAAASAVDDDTVRAVLLRGEGPSFSSGRDTTKLGQRPGGISDRDYIARAQQGRLTILDCPKPVVAALKGYVLGGAFEIALSADIRVGDETTALGFPEIRFGLVPDTGGTQLLTILAGPARAKYLIVSGERIDAGTALAWGILDGVVPAGAADDRAFAIARQLAAAPPQAAAAAKRLVDRLWRDRIRDGLQDELDAQVELFAERRRQTTD